MEATNELQQAYKAGESGSAAGFLRQSTLGTVEDIWDNFHLTDFTQDPHPFLNKAYPIVSDQTYIGRDDRQTDMTEAMRKGANVWGNAWKLGATAMDAAKESIPTTAVGEIWKNILANAVTNAIAEQSGISREEAQRQAIQWLVSNNYLSDLVDLEKQQADLALAEQNQGWGAKATANLSGAISRLALPILVGKYFSPAAGRAMLAASVGGQTWQEAIGAGATPDQARQAGLPTMLKSYIIESLAGGVRGLGKGVLPQPLSKPGRYVGGALGEAGEGFADGLFQDYINKGTWNSDAQWTSEEELAQEALRDFLISLLLQGAEGVALSGKSKVVDTGKTIDIDSFTKSGGNDMIQLTEAEEIIIARMDFSEISRLKYRLSDRAARLWYDTHCKSIHDLVDRNQIFEDQARQACELRNTYRTQSRDLMHDQKKRAELDAKYPNESFEQLIERKMQEKNMTREQAIRDIYKTAIKTNKKVNKRLGVR